MTLAKLSRNGRVTLPASVRAALRVKDGDYLEAELVENGVLLRPVAAGDRERAWASVMAIVREPKWIGPGPEPSEDELMDLIVDEIHALRAEKNAKGGPR